MVAAGLGLAASVMSSIATAISSMVFDGIIAVMTLVGAIVSLISTRWLRSHTNSMLSQILSVNMNPSQCTNKDVYGHYTTTGWYWKIFPCKYTPMTRALEAFCWLGFLSLLATIPLALRDMRKKREAQRNATNEIATLPQTTEKALPQSTDRKPRVEEVVEVV